MATPIHSAKVPAQHAPTPKDLAALTSRLKQLAASFTISGPRERIEAAVMWSRSWEPHVYLNSTDGRKGWALVPYPGEPTPEDPSGSGQGARLAAIIAAAEGAKLNLFVEVATKDYDPNFGDGAGWFGTVTKVSLGNAWPDGG